MRNFVRNAKELIALILILIAQRKFRPKCIFCKYKEECSEDF